MYNQRPPWQQVMNLLFPGQQPWTGGGGTWLPPGGTGFPGQQGSFPPGPPPGVPTGPGLPDGPPPGPPPSTILALAQGFGVGTFAVDPGSMYGCLRRYTYVTLENGRRFWFWPTFIGRTSVAGYRWRPRQYRWDYAGFDTRQIASFYCT